MWWSSRPRQSIYPSVHVLPLLFLYGDLSGSGHLLFTAETLLCLKVSTTCVRLSDTVLLRSALNAAAEKQDAAAKMCCFILQWAPCFLPDSLSVLQCTGHGSVQ